MSCLDIKGQILLIDPEPEIFQKFAAATDLGEFRFVHVRKVADGLSNLALEKFDIVLFREHLADISAKEFVSQVSSSAYSPTVIVLGSENNPHVAEKLLTNGVWDYIDEFQNISTLRDNLINILKYRSEAAKHKKDHDEICERIKNGGIIGSSRQIQNCLDLVVKAGPSEANILIVGDSGTGKELFARAIHSVSPRSDKKMVVVDCASLPENLVESLLFGHMRGAFTGADRDRAGLISQAHGSTLFLDEIGELSLDIQKKFLRVLQERKLRPVGGSKTVISDFRLIAATNRDLQHLVKEGLFREDLFFRLKTFQIDLPPLHSRPTDIPVLAYYFVNAYCKENNLETKKMSPEFLIALRRYNWPGNIRELFNSLEHAIASARENTTLLPVHLPVDIRVQAIVQANENEGQAEELMGVLSVSGPQNFPKLQDVRKDAMENIERKYLQKLLRVCGKDITQACEISNISRSRLYALLKKYRISRL